MGCLAALAHAADYSYVDLRISYGVQFEGVPDDFEVIRAGMGGLEYSLDGVGYANHYEPSGWEEPLPPDHEISVGTSAEGQSADVTSAVPTHILNGFVRSFGDTTMAFMLSAGAKATVIGVVVGDYYSRHDFGALDYGVRLSFSDGLGPATPRFERNVSLHQHFGRVWKEFTFDFSNDIGVDINATIRMSVGATVTVFDHGVTSPAPELATYSLMLTGC